MINKDGPLKGIKVIEVAQWVAAPAAGALLASLGAEVIHVEHSRRGDAFRGFRPLGLSLDTPNYVMELDNHSKKSLAVDISKPEGQEIIRKLCNTADVFINNLRPREIMKWGLDYDTVCKNNPKIIVANLLGAGKKGPRKDEPGNDLTDFWARSGIMASLAPPDSTPQVSRGGFGDHMTALALSAGIAYALFIRERTGIGQEVNVSLYNTGIYALGIDYQTALNITPEIGQIPRTQAPNPLMNYYKTRDNRWLIISMPSTDIYWERICNVLEIQYIQNNPNFTSHSSRCEHNEELVRILDAAFSKKDYEEWETSLTSARIPWAPIQTVAEVIKDPQAIANEFFIEVQHPVHGKIKMVNAPVKFSKTPTRVYSAMPDIGENTDEILLAAGYSWEQISELKIKNVIP
ncbi:MAG TPA: CoA transferase [Dehalococcoidales bacterium]|nr:CoA transferase [Dehalococcoidales bacterium]